MSGQFQNEDSFRQAEVGGWEWGDRVRAGDHGAFDALMERYKRPVLNFVYRMIGDAAEAEDVAQEVRMALLRHLRRIMTRANPQTFITVAARREAIRALRRLCRDEYSGALVHIEDDEGILQLFYSSTGTSDDYLD